MFAKHPLCPLFPFDAFIWQKVVQFSWHHLMNISSRCSFRGRWIVHRFATGKSTQLVLLRELCWNVSILRCSLAVVRVRDPQIRQVSGTNLSVLCEGFYAWGQRFEELLKKSELPFDRRASV